MESTVVDISIPPSFKPVSLSNSRICCILKTLKQVHFFNVVKFNYFLYFFVFVSDAEVTLFEFYMQHCDNKLMTLTNGALCDSTAAGPGGQSCAVLFQVEQILDIDRRARKDQKDRIARRKELNGKYFDLWLALILILYPPHYVSC